MSPDYLFSDYPSGNGSIFAAHARASELASKITRYYRVAYADGKVEKMLLTDEEVAYLQGQGNSVEEIR